MSGARGRLARTLRALVVVLAALFLLATRAQALADDLSPADVAAPLAEPLLPLVLPPLPVSYQSQRLGWWTVSYPAAVRGQVQPLIDHADAWKAELAADFGQDVLAQPIEVRIGRTWSEMSALVPHELGVPAYAAGVTYGPLRLVLLSLTEPGGEATDLGTVFHHELAHVALDDATAGRHVPRWFNEGLAVHESGEHPVLRMRALWDAILFRQLLPLSDLDRGFPVRSDEVNIAYAESADVVRFFLRGKDHTRFVSLLERVRDGSTFDRALADAYGTDVRRLEYQWREESAKRNTFAPMLASGSFIWVLAMVALVLGYRRRKRQAAETLARWEREEKRDALLAAAPTGAEDDRPFRDPSLLPRELPKVEHDGGWHTLH